MPRLSDIVQSDTDYAQSLLNARRNAIPSDFRPPEQGGTRGVGLQGGMELGSVGGIPVSLTDLIPADMGVNSLAMLGKAGAAKLAGGTALAGIFAGKGAKTANLAALMKAEGMKAQGIADDVIHKQTGWFFGMPDGKPRFEIPDNAAQVNNLPINQSWGDFSRDIQLPRKANAKQFAEYKKQIAEKENIYNTLNRTMRPIEDIYSHPQVYNEYPDLLNLSAHHRPEIGLNGSYGGGKIEFGDVSNPEGVKGLFGHELQHAIQQREGFARGGSPEGMAAAIPLNELDLNSAQLIQRRIARGDTPSEAARWLKATLGHDVSPQIMDAAMQKNILLSPHDQYKRLAGEAEARLTQARMNMTPEQRLANYPPSMFDVPVDQQLVRYGN